MTHADWADVPLAYAAASPIHGTGLFARTSIAAGEFIGVYEGTPTQENGMHVLWIEAEQEGHWEGIDGTNALRFLNHSRRPNAELDGQDLYALYRIAPDEEITIDYGPWFEEEG